ncbi:hypothetical protein U14_04663 [Candidatus Moduliflexus flocculans]|uniref:Xylose isomerase-like TIM barrel domain-containing protein n=1 Tax=Candidatus Moduliflexus flocculans TaxID=1499966 RepID=A0A0S6W5X3_9BACT|nr:hypothetical protein U14_04663 [Candidatus Moduliflexus flocculans]
MIKIGTCVKGNEFYTNLSSVAEIGFESIQLYFPASLNGFNIENQQEIIDHLKRNGIKMNSIGLYCNPLQNSSSREEIIKCLKNGAKLGIDVFSTFAGAIENGTVDGALPLFKKYFSEFLEIAKDHNIKIAIENYPAYGFWYNTRSNIGFCPRAWEMMFNEIDDEYLGLEWEPSHQIDQFIDPIKQLKKWAHKIVHVHGKDCHVDKELLAEVGTLSCLNYSSHRFPGFGDTNWIDVFNTLNRKEYQGSITIEGYHDPIYCNEKELEGQKLAFEYLKQCRASAYQPAVP